MHRQEELFSMTLTQIRFHLHGKKWKDTMVVHRCDMLLTPPTVAHALPQLPYQMYLYVLTLEIYCWAQTTLAILPFKV